MNQCKVKDRVFTEGEVISTEKYGDFMIVSIEEGCTTERKGVLIRYLDTGYEKMVTPYSITKTKGYDPYAPKIAGVGFYGEGPYVSRIGNSKAKTPQYRCWENMMYRVYGDHRLSNRYKDRGVTVCEEWHNYQTFAKWFDENYIEGFVLEKDIKSEGKLEYNPDNCIFVPQELNKFFGAMNKNRGEYPVGVQYPHKVKGKAFTVMINIWDGVEEKIVTRKDHKCYDQWQAFNLYKFHKELALKCLATHLLLNGGITQEVHDKLWEWEAVPYPE